jgi:hypothetical protein
MTLLVAPPAKNDVRWLWQPPVANFGGWSHRASQRHFAMVWLQWLQRKVANFRTTGSEGVSLDSEDNRKISHRSVSNELRVTGTYFGSGIVTEYSSGASAAICPVVARPWLQTASKAPCKSSERSNSRRLHSLGVNKFSAAARRSGIFTMG